MKPQRRVRCALVGTCAIVALLAGTLACVPLANPVAEPAILMTPGRSAGFFSFPWPNEIRKTAAGKLDLAGFPGVALNPLMGDVLPAIPLLPSAIQRASSALTDFGTNTAVYFQSSTPIEQSSLPSATESTRPDSSVMLIDLDHGGSRMPVIAVADSTSTRFRPKNTLTLLPYPGHPLRPGTNYAAVLFSGIRDKQARDLSRSTLLDQLDSPWQASTGATAVQWTALQSQRDEIAAAVQATTLRSASEIIAFTQYRTQEVSTELDAITSTMNASAPPQINVSSLGPCEADLKASGALTAKLVGTMDLPTWMQGPYPYLTEGGSILITPEGRAIAQGSITSAVTARIPCGEAPTAGWPVAAYINGTGGTADIDTNRPQFDTNGWIVGVIAPLYSGAVNPLLVDLGVDDYLAEGLLIYNFLNPVSARFSPIQQAANHLALLRGLKQLSLDGSLLGTSGPVTASQTVDLISGHSQGAQTLSLVATMDPQIDGVFSSAGSGGQYHSISHTALRSALALFAGEPESLDELSPLVQLIQTILEPSDAINYPTTPNFLNVAGAADDCAVLETSRHYAGATELAIANQQSPSSIYGEPALDPPTVQFPATANANGKTRVSVETPGGHYSASANRWIGTNFVNDIAAERIPVVTSGRFAVSTALCGRGRWDNTSDTFGR